MRSVLVEFMLGELCVFVYSESHEQWYVFIESSIYTVKLSIKLSVSFSQRQKILKCLWTKNFGLQKCESPLNENIWAVQN